MSGDVMAQEGLKTAIVLLFTIYSAAVCPLRRCNATPCLRILVDRPRAAGVITSDRKPRAVITSRYIQVARGERWGGDVSCPVRAHCRLLQLCTRHRSCSHRSEVGRRGAKGMASQRTAVVTGGTGYVATELIAQLLARGYAVRATLRSDPDGPRGSALRSLAAAPAATAAGGSLELVRVADLADPGPALHTALEGAGVLFHVASPFRFDGDPSDDIVRPAVEGTRAVLTAAAKHKGAGGLRRVVVTSSVCAIHDMRRAQPPKAEQYNEQDWNETSTIKDEAYWVSKVCMCVGGWVRVWAGRRGGNGRCPAALVPRTCMLQQT